ncbi:hypothetical protein D3C71_1374610 [compost metagenome]
MLSPVDPIDASDISGVCFRSKPETWTPLDFTVIDSSIQILSTILPINTINTGYNVTLSGRHHELIVSGIANVHGEIAVGKSSLIIDGSDFEIECCHYVP